MTKEKQLGERIKQLREFKKLSIDDLSNRSKLDINQIDAIENGDAVPSIGTLVKISRALGVRPGTLIDDHDKTGAVVKRAGEITEGNSFSNKNTSSHEHLSFFPLASENSGRHMEPFVVLIEPANDNNYVSSSHEGEEFIYVLEGEIEVKYGNETYILKPGDSIYYDSIVMHHVHAYGSTQAKIVAVIYVPF